MYSSSQDCVSSDLILPLILHRWRPNRRVTCSRETTEISPVPNRRTSLNLALDISPHTGLQDKDAQTQSGLQIISIYKVHTFDLLRETEVGGFSDELASKIRQLVRTFHFDVELSKQDF